MKRNNVYLNKLRCQGVNLINFINKCSDNKIELEDLVRIDSKTIEFSLTDNNLNKLKRLNLGNYKIEVISQGGIKKVFRILYMRMGLIIGVILALFILIFSQNRLVNIQIMGLTTIEEKTIESALREYGINKYDVMDFDISELENYIYEKFDLSFVSIITKGNSLIINLKEEIPKISQTYEPITAPYNMIITKLNVYSGTSHLKMGDIVFRGDIVVAPYEIKNNEKIDVVPCAELEGDTYFSESYAFYNEEERLVRTGKSKIIESQILMGKIKLFDTKSTCSFEQYETINQELLVSDYFLPININKTIVYELKSETFIHDFEKEKDEIISKLKDKAYKKVPSHMGIDNEEIKISSTNYGNIVTIYLKSSVYLKYNIN